jgi:uncharacterized protein
MRRRLALTVLLAAAVFLSARAALQIARARSPDEGALREYTGVYQWGPDAFVYLQLWHEFVGFDKPPQLVAFDESGDVRTLYPDDRDRFSTGAGAAVRAPVESRIEFQRNAAGAISGMTWRSEKTSPRTAQRVDIEKHEEVRFASEGVQLAGTLVSPATPGRHAAIILVHGSGAENREYILPWARFLVRHGMAVLSYDKRGVGGSTGDWKQASFDDLAEDVVAAFSYLKSRADINVAQVGLLGVSQAGWIMPLAAVRAAEFAFLISISGAGVPVADTTLDQMQNEMRASGMQPHTIAEILAVMKLQYEFARSGDNWDAYASAREKLAARVGRPPDTFPATRQHPHWDFIRRLYFYDPAPTLRRLQAPTLAIWGELDNNILPDKNRAAWEAALEAGGNRDYTLVILPKANHALFEATFGHGAEGPSLKRFVPAYFRTVREWLAARIGGFSAR